jgi:DNA repair protein RAD16
MATTLLPYQEEGLAWMRERELDPQTRGGILADEQGLGKTIQAISCILTNLPEPGPMDHERVPPLRTLVVVPMALVSQWSTEFTRFARVTKQWGCVCAELEV